MTKEKRYSIYETKEARESQSLKRLTDLAKQQKRSFNFCVLDAIEEYLKNHSEENTDHIDLSAVVRAP